MIHARTLTLAAGVTVLAAQLWAAPAALAAPRDGAPAQGSGVMGLDEWRAQVTDTAGVPIEKYRALPLDHGTAIELDIEHSMKRSALVSILDLLWGIHYEIVTTVMWLLHTLLSFEWVGWFAAPMESFGAAVGQMVAQIHWIPLASMISGLAIALLFAARKRGAAWGELALSVTMVIVATNMALNPVAYVTGDNGVLTKAEEAAGQISVEIAGGADKVEIARDLGCDVVVDRREQDVIEAVKEATDGRGVDVVYDPVGGPSYTASTKCIAFEGRIVVVGFASGRVPEPRLNHALVKNYSILGLHWSLYQQHDPAAVQEAHADLVRLADAGAVRPLVAETFGFDEVPAALARLAGGSSTGRIVVTGT